MDKFSHIKKKNNVDKEEKCEILYQDDDFKILNYKKLNILKEENIVCVLPYFIEMNKIMLKYEKNKYYEYSDGIGDSLSIFTKEIKEIDTIEKAIRKELEEESGIILRDDYEFEELNTLYKSKTSTCICYMYLIPLNERDYQESIPLVMDKDNKPIKIDVKYIDKIKISDLLTGYMMLKMKEYLNV
jgi:hypothetical protein